MFCILPTAKNVYAFQVFTPEFCEEFIEEINHFENIELPKGRPNTMNNYGVCWSVFTISIINIPVLRFSKSEPRRRQCFFDKKQHTPSSTLPALHNTWNQGAKKIIFTACHSGKLKLAFTSPGVISTRPKSFLTSKIDFTVLLLFELLMKHHLPVGQVKNGIH